MSKHWLVVSLWVSVAGAPDPLPSRGEDLRAVAGPLPYGAGQLEAALEHAPELRLRVAVAKAGDPILRGMDERDLPSQAAESYTISVHEGSAFIVGRDAVGAMYGALAAAAQVQSTGKLTPERK